MFFGHPDAIIAKWKIIEMFIFSVATNLDGKFLAGIIQRIIQQITEDGV